MSVKGEVGNYFVVRTPSLPLDMLDSVHAIDSETVADFVKGAMSNHPQVEDALYIASGELFDEIRHHLDNDLQFPEKLSITLYKYFLRMASRATPFGLFSSIAHGTILPASTDIRLGGKIIPYTCIDMGLSRKICDNLLSDLDCYPYLTFYPNSSIHYHEDHYRYFIYQDCDGKQECHWIRVAKNPLIEAILERAGEGASFNSLLETAAVFNIPENRAIDFIFRLTNEQLLHTDLEPTISGEKHFTEVRSLIGKLISPVQQPSKYSGYIELGETLDYINCRHFRIAKSVSRIKPEIKSANVFQTDSRTHINSSKLGKCLSEAIVREIVELFPIRQNNVPKQLIEFRDRFSKRYGDMEVPLLEALDLDRGVGYGNSAYQYFHENPLLDGLNFNSETADMPGSLMEKCLQKDLHNEIAGGQRVLRLELENLAESERNRNLPIVYDQGCYALGNLLSTIPGKQPDLHNYCFHLLACGGPSSIPLMARFAHLDDRLKESLVGSAELEKELNHDAIVAEIVHMPGKRIGNILKRPSFHQYEIPVLGRSDVPRANQIPLSDILVSVIGGEVVLRSIRFGKVIKPRLSSAHNYHTGMNVYRFLCDVQEQGAFRFSWDWGEAQKWRKFLPRVCYKHLILCRAQWVIPSHALKKFKNLPQMEAISEIRNLYGIPEDVILAEGDNEIPLRLTTKLSVGIFLGALKSKDVRIYESLYPEFSSPVADENRMAYHNEIIIPFTLHSKPIPKSLRKSNNFQSMPRVFPPGSEWVYLKLYCGQKEADRVLADHICPLLSETAKKISLKRWFFIRYFDTDFHLRLRFQLKDVQNVPSFTDILSRKFGGLISSGLIHSMQFDTYFRELERYGGIAIELCEEIFHQHSEFLLSVSPMLIKAEFVRMRWMLAVKGVDRLLDSFLLSITEKFDLVSSWRSAMLLEYTRPDDLKRMLDVRYRELKADLSESLDVKNEIFPFSGSWEELWSSVTSFAHGIKLTFGKGWSVSPNNEKSDLLFSLSHMNLNRIFYCSQRENELVIYHLLSKYYLMLAKKKEKQQGKLDSNRENRASETIPFRLPLS